VDSARGNKSSGRSSKEKNQNSSRRSSKISATPRVAELEQSATFISQLLGAEGGSDEEDGRDQLISGQQGTSIGELPHPANVVPSSLEDSSIFTEARDPRAPGGEEGGDVLQPPEDFASSLEQSLNGDSVDDASEFIRAHASLSRIQTER
jgi:hypothetical protein